MDGKCRIVIEGAAAAKHNARKTHGVLGAEKIDLSKAGGHSHKWGVKGTNTLSRAGSFMICIKNLRNVSTR